VQKISRERFISTYYLVTKYTADLYVYILVP
jgi:hypothetical protein